MKGATARIVDPCSALWGVCGLSVHLAISSVAPGSFHCRSGPGGAARACPHQGRDGRSVEVGGDCVTSCHGAAASVAVFRALHDLGWEGRSKRRRRSRASCGLRGSSRDGRRRACSHPRVSPLPVGSHLVHADSAGYRLRRRIRSCTRTPRWRYALAHAFVLGGGVRYRAPLGAIGTIGAVAVSGLFWQNRKLA